MSDPASKKSVNSKPTVLSLAQLLEQQPSTAPACLVEPGLLPPQGILFVGGEPKVGKSLLVANLALSLAAGADRIGFPIPAPRRVLICQSADFFGASPVASADACCRIVDPRDLCESSRRT